VLKRADWDRVEAIFHDLADLPDDDERQRQMRDACGGDPALIAEVCSLLEGDRVVRDSASGGEPHTGLKLGAFTITRLIARGGMASVYEGRRDDGEFTQRVAVKIMDLRLSDPALVAQFKAERQILAGLEHPSVTRLVDGGVTDRGEPYLVMEFVDGVPFDRYCDEQQLTVPARLALFTQVCDAVAYAHRALVLHRDLKPANILVTREGRVKVVDFGTATLLQPDRLATISLAPLTPAYASPEQLTGRPVGTASDQYSLGVVLYGLLTGVAPFADRPSLLSAIERAMAGAATAAPQTMITESAAAARQTSMARLRNMLAKDLGTIVTKALAVDPAARYASVQHLSDDLTRWADGAPIQGRPPSVAYHAARFLQRHWAASLVAGALSLGLAGATVVSIRAAADARAQAARADDQGRRASEVTRFLTTMLGSADPGALGKDITVREVLQRASTNAAALDPTPQLAAEVRAVIGRTFLGLGDYAAAEQQLRVAVAAQRKVAPTGSIEAVRLLTLLSNVQEADGRVDEAARTLDEADALLRRLPQADAAVRAEHLDQRGRILALRGEFTTAIPIFEQALALTRTTPLPPEARSRAAANLGFALANLGRHRESVALYAEAVAQARAAFGPAALQVADRMSPYASALWYAGERQRALTVYEEVLAIRRKIQGGEHPDYAYTLANYADSLIWLGQYERAIPLAQEVLALRGKTLEDTHPMVPFAMALMGRALGPIGRIDEADRWLRDSLALRQRTLPKDHWALASSRSSIGGNLVLARRFPEAENLLLGAERDLVQTLGDGAPVVADARRRLVDLYTAWNRPADAQKWRDRLPGATP